MRLGGPRGLFVCQPVCRLGRVPNGRQPPTTANVNTGKEPRRGTKQATTLSQEEKDEKGYFGNTPVVVPAAEIRRGTSSPSSVLKLRLASLSGRLISSASSPRQRRTDG